MADYRDAAGGENADATNSAATQFLTTMADRLAVAEDRLSVPHGTLARLYTETDHNLVIKIIAACETMLNELIEHSMTSGLGLGVSQTKIRALKAAADLLTRGLSLQGRPSKISLAKSLNMLDTDDAKFVGAVARIRNRYAHNIRNSDSRITDLAPSEPDFWKNLTYGLILKKEEVPDDLLKIFVTQAFANFLHISGQRIHIQSGGLFGLLSIPDNVD